MLSHLCFHFTKDLIRDIHLWISVPLAEGFISVSQNSIEIELLYSTHIYLYISTPKCGFHLMSYLMPVLIYNSRLFPSIHDQFSIRGVSHAIITNTDLHFLINTPFMYILKMGWIPLFKPSVSFATLFHRWIPQNEVMEVFFYEWRKSPFAFHAQSSCFYMFWFVHTLYRYIHIYSYSNVIWWLLMFSCFLYVPL